jgi:hypothetical protein
VGWRTGPAQHDLNWIGNSIPQLVTAMPLEFFGLFCLIIILMILYSAWENRRNEVIVALFVISELSILTQISLTDFTPIFVRYTLFLVPLLITIGVLPIVALLERDDVLPAQKAFVLIIFFGLFFAVLYYQFFCVNFYVPRGFTPIPP